MLQKLSLGHILPCRREVRAHKSVVVELVKRFIQRSFKAVGSQSGFVSILLNKPFQFGHEKRIGDQEVILQITVPVVFPEILFEHLMGGKA